MKLRSSTGCPPSASVAFWIGGLPITSKMVFQVTGLVILSFQSYSILESLTSSYWLELFKESKSQL